MSFPYPSENQDPWYQAFQDFVSALDASTYAAREDRHIILGGGGTFSFDASADTLDFDADLEIYSPIKGLRFTVAPTTVSLPDGSCFYVDLVRAPLASQVLVAQSANTVPSSDTAYIIAVRSGNSVYFRHGLELPTGSSRQIFAGGGGGPGAILWAAGRESHDSDVTPLVVGAFAFSPTVHDPVSSIVFRAVAANSDISLTNKVQLINVTDGELVAELTFTSTSLAKDEVTLTRGGGLGEIDDPEHIYEVRILLGAPPVGSESIELYSAELRVF
jgi:hypothetical protein